MNQILISEKLYMTPEIKKKKSMYKVYFFLSVFLVFILSSYYIYAEYDKNKEEEESHEILASMSFENKFVDDTVIKFEDNAIVVILNEEDDSEPFVISSTYDDDVEINVEEEDNTSHQETVHVQKFVTDSGQEYWSIARLYIPSIECEYGILNTWSDELLKKSPCYFHGAEPNQIGNFCIIGHNYRNSKFFSKVPDLNYGDIIEITDLTNTTLKYAVYDKYEIDPNDRTCTSQLTNGYRDITLITCTDDGSARIVVKAREVE